ncbi:hypothetical protein [Mycobacterium sp. SMC-19]|uniref:hypothetical protein n=1 Tax=Mycobacterium sp. SMC-19 TaxID=3381630 RepID=UPI003876DA4E
MTATRTARRFFWAWLIASAAVSTTGVVTHAALGNARSPVIASALAATVVCIQVCATFGVHMLVQARIAGAAYRTAVAAAVVLAIGAFTLNYVALRDLVIGWAGIAPGIAWIAPLIIDLGMTASMVALLALSQPAPQAHTAEHHTDTPPSVHVAVHNTVSNALHSAEPTAHDGAHLDAAHRLVATGLVRIGVERVAQVLEAHASGTAPSTIARRLNVGFSTVRRVIDYQHQAVS